MAKMRPTKVNEASEIEGQLIPLNIERLRAHLNQMSSDKLRQLHDRLYVVNLAMGLNSIAANNPGVGVRALQVMREILAGEGFQDI